jgi:hypothetical protein
VKFVSVYCDIQLSLRAESIMARGGTGGTMSNVSQFPGVIIIIVAISLAL